MRVADMILSFGNFVSDSFVSLARCPVLSLSSTGFQEMGIVAELSTGGKNGLITGIYCRWKWKPDIRKVE